MQTRADSGTRQPIVAGLKRSGCICHREQARPSRAQCVQAGDVDAGPVERFGREAGAETPGQNVKARGVAGGTDYGDARTDQAFGQPLAEGAGCADQQDGSVRSTRHSNFRCLNCRQAAQDHGG